MAAGDFLRAIRRAADQQSDKHAAADEGRTLLLDVTAVAVGASPKGNAVITLSWRGKDVVAKDYDISYTPTVGDRARCEVVQGQLIVRGAMAG